MRVAAVDAAVKEPHIHRPSGHSYARLQLDDANLHAWNQHGVDLPEVFSDHIVQLGLQARPPPQSLRALSVAR